MATATVSRQSEHLYRTAWLSIASDLPPVDGEVYQSVLESWIARGCPKRDLAAFIHVLVHHGQPDPSRIVSDR